MTQRLMRGGPDTLRYVKRAAVLEKVAPPSWFGLR